MARNGERETTVRFGTRGIDGLGGVAAIHSTGFVRQRPFWAKRDRASESQVPSGFQLTGRRRGSTENRKTNNKIKKESELVSSIGDQVESGEEGNERTRGLGDGGRAKDHERGIRCRRCGRWLTLASTPGF